MEETKPIRTFRFSIDHPEWFTSGLDALYIEAPDIDTAYSLAASQCTDGWVVDRESGHDVTEQLARHAEIFERIQRTGLVPAIRSTVSRLIGPEIAGVVPMDSAAEFEFRLRPEVNGPDKK